MAKTIDEILEGKMSDEHKAIYKDQLAKVQAGEIGPAEAIRNIREAGVEVLMDMPTGTTPTEML